MPRKFPAFSSLPLLLTVTVLTVASNASTDTPPAKPAITPPNFIFILADDQAWNGLSVPMTKGDDSSKSKEFHTPNIEALATSGMTFSWAYAAHPKCECSRASILMGRTTTSLNAPTRSSTKWSAPATESLANSLKQCNPAYRTAHFGKWQWRQTPTSMGYDSSDGITQNETGDSSDASDPKLLFSMTTRACEFVSQSVKDSHPFYMQLSYYAVHPKAQSLAETLKKYEGLAGGGRRGDRALMAAMTEDLDTCVGKLMKQLQALGIAKNTYIIYMSDNGGRTGVLNGGKGNLGEGGLRVPLIVAGPGVRADTYCTIPVISYDILATVLDLAAPKCAPAKGIEGGSWRDLLKDGDHGTITRSIDRLVWHQPVELDHPQSAIRKGDYKLLYEWDTHAVQLFNLALDRGEKHDLSKENPELTTKLQSELIAHVRAGLGDNAIAELESGVKQEGRKRSAPQPKGF